MCKDSVVSLVRRSVVEARLVKAFKQSSGGYRTPRQLVSMASRPRRGFEVRLSRSERMHFTELASRMILCRELIQRYRRLYCRRPRAFYGLVFGFPARPGQRIKVVWGEFNIHFLFEKNDLVSFWRRVKWGPGSGGYYSVGDRDVKVKELRGLISFSRREECVLTAADVLRHEAVHAFEDYVKGRRPPHDGCRRLQYSVKSELSAYMPNFRRVSDRCLDAVNEEARLGLGYEVRNLVGEYLGIDDTRSRISHLRRLRRTADKYERIRLREKVLSTRRLLEKKKVKLSAHMSEYRRICSQLRRALRVVPVPVLQAVVYETPYERLHQRIPEAAEAYRLLCRRII